MHQLFRLFNPLSAVLGVVFLASGFAATSGCGGNSGGGNNLGLDFGYIQTTPGGPTSEVYLDPSPPSVAPTAVVPGSSPKLTLYDMAQFSSGVYDYSYPGYDYTATTQVVYGTVSGVNLSDVQLEVYAYTNGFYIQPLVNCFVHINANGTWVCPSNPGVIHALLVRSGYVVPAFTALPPVDGVNILAEL